MGEFVRNCPSKEFLNKRSIEFFEEIEGRIRSLFNIEVTPNFPMTEEKFCLTNQQIENIKFEIDNDFSPPNLDTSIPSYHIPTGCIIIPPSYYSERSFIHEILHAFSNPTLPALYSDSGNRLNTMIREGLTEFFTGCLLYRYYPSCYIFFREPRHETNFNLGYNYLDETRFWYVFIKKFGIKGVLKIYFDRKLKINSYKELQNSLIELIRTIYPQFTLTNPNNIYEWDYRLFKPKDLEGLINLDFSIFPFLR